MAVMMRWRFCDGLHGAESFHAFPSDECTDQPRPFGSRGGSGLGSPSLRLMMRSRWRRGDVALSVPGDCRHVGGGGRDDPATQSKSGEVRLERGLFADHAGARGSTSNLRRAVRAKQSRHGLITATRRRWPEACYAILANLGLGIVPR